MNILPNTAASPAEVRRIERAAARWLAANDPNHQKLKAVAKLRAKRAALKTRMHRT